MAERYQLPRSCVPPTIGRKDGGFPHPGAWKVERHGASGRKKTWSPYERGRPPFKGDSPCLRPQPSRAESSPTCSKALPCGAGAGSRMSCRPAPSRRSQTAARGARNRPTVTSDPPLLPRPTGERGGQPCRRHAIAPSGRTSPTPDTPAWRPRPTCRATGAPDAACKQLYHLRHHRASSIAEPIPRLEATQRATQQRQPDAATNAAKGGPAVMTVAGAREQRTRRQPSSRPIQGQQENPLSRREDNAPVIRSSNGSRTRNGSPANYSPRRINSAAGQAALLAGAAGDASPSPKQPCQKRYAASFGFVSFFLFSSFSISCDRDRERGIP
jgi:hypothetical protein